MRILIAEDDTVSRMILKKAVESLGHQCIVSVDGADAWEKYEKSPADVIISDWMMPGIDGLELCRRVRAHASSSYTYFIVLSTLGDRKHYLTGMQAGADDYLTKPLDLDELRVRLISAGRVTGLHKRLAEQKEELERLNRKLHEEGRRDPLTGVGNRLRLQEDLHDLLTRVHHAGQTCSLALCDIDFFKKYNDTYGHLAGDQTLQTVARTILSHSRAEDFVYRYGGEEFLVVLPDQNLENASLVLRRIAREVTNLAIPHSAGVNGEVLTISAGVSELQPGQRIDVDLALRQADAALYQAKERGRNQVVVYSSEMDASSMP